jgi:hypothetical protein
MSSEASDIDAMIERIAREEQDDLDCKQGQHILDVTDYARRSQRQGNAEDPLVQVLRQAHQAKVEEDNQQ